jgi:hypothetical protein
MSKKLLKLFKNKVITVSLTEQAAGSPMIVGMLLDADEDFLFIGEIESLPKDNKPEVAIPRSDIRLILLGNQVPQDSTELDKEFGKPWQ